MRTSHKLIVCGTVSVLVTATLCLTLAGHIAESRRRAYYGGDDFRSVFFYRYGESLEQTDEQGNYTDPRPTFEYRGRIRGAITGDVVYGLESGRIYIVGKYTTWELSDLIDGAAFGNIHGQEADTLR